MRMMVFILCVLGVALSAAPRVECGVESRDVALGEAFTYQIVVSDAKNIDDIAFPSNDDFQVRAQTPSRNNSTSMSIVNGNVTKTERHETICNFILVAKRKGTLTIPSLKVVADGKTFRTREIRVNVGDGETISDIILELSFDSSECYVGQTLMAKWTLFFGERLKNIGEFDLPLFTNGAFSFPAYEDKIDQNNTRSYRRLPVSGVDGVIGRIGRGTHDGESMMCLTFSRPVTAMKAGVFSIDAGSVVCEIPDRRARKRRSVDPFFDDFFDRTPMRSILIKGAAVNLTVRELPQEGRPDDFTGIVGRCSVAVEAKPLEVNVGDPIVMTLSVDGLAYPDTVRIPPFAAMAALAGKFRVSDEDSGIVRDGAKLFQCTLRALNKDVSEIPPLKVPFFNSATGKYEYAESKAIPLVVHEVSTVTAADMQGSAAAQEPLAGAEPESLDSGIAHNYACDKLTGSSVPGFSHWSFGGWKFILCVCCIILYIAMASVVAAMHRRNANPERLAMQQAASEALKRISKAGDGDSSELFKDLQTVIAARLSLPSGALSYNDVAPALEKAGMKVDSLKRLSALFADFEAANYAGGASRKGIADDTRSLAREIQHL